MTPPLHHKILTGIAVVMIFQSALTLILNRQGTSVTPTATTSARANYGPQVCDNAFHSDIHHEKDVLDHFTVDLGEGCFSGFVYLPPYWAAGWFHQPTGDTNNWWVAYWFANYPSPNGPYGPNDKYSFDNHPLVFRLQGHGKILFYTSVVKP
jgi:hypothetical protein